jgi:hypothetical protein
MGLPPPLQLHAWVVAYGPVVLHRLSLCREATTMSMTFWRKKKEETKETPTAGVVLIEVVLMVENVLESVLEMVLAGVMGAEVDFGST